MKIKSLSLLLSIITLLSLVNPNLTQAATTCSVTSDKTTYTSGDTIKFTVTFSDGYYYQTDYTFLDKDGKEVAKDSAMTQSGQVVSIGTPNEAFTQVKVTKSSGAVGPDYQCSVNASSTGPTGPVAVPLPLPQDSNTTNTAICTLVGNPTSSPNTNDPTDRKILMTLLNSSDDDIKVHVTLQYTQNEKIKYGDDVTLAGQNTSNIKTGSFYFLPVPTKAPAGRYLVIVTTKQGGLFPALCVNSGKQVTLEAIPNSNRDLTSTLKQVYNPAPFSSLGSILTALIPNLFALAGLLAFAFLVFGGIRYALARGDAKATDAARGVITNAITGLVIILAVFIIFEIINAVFGFSLFSLAPLASAQSVDIGCAVKLGTKCIKDAFPSFGSLVTVIVAAATALMGLIFFFLLVWGGIRYMLANGDEKATQSARGVLTSAVIGLLIVLGAFAIISLISLLTGIDLIP